MIRQRFNEDWTFSYMNKSLILGMIEQDSTDEITLPHDYIISMDRDPNAKGGADVGFYPGENGKYGKVFVAPENWQDKIVILEFEGVFKDADIYLNNDLIHKHAYGYTAFHVDLTHGLNIGGDNELRVEVRNDDQPNSRWYTGGGIYRHVNLLVSDPVHILPWGTFVYTPVVNEEDSLVCIETEVVNKTSKYSHARVVNKIYDATGQIVASENQPVRLAPNASAKLVQKMLVDEPELWSCESPYLYEAVTEVIINDEVTDKAVTSFGIRSITFDAKHGFRLNGETINLKGGCIHHDNGLLGACAFDRAEERRVQLHKEAGFNAIRSAHNPPSEALLKACDQHGILVINENFDCWRRGKRDNDYAKIFEANWAADTEAMVLSSRNHPSVIMYSIGNEVMEVDGNSEGALVARQLSECVKKFDTTRAVTAGIHYGIPLPEFATKVYMEAQTLPDGDYAGITTMSKLGHLFAFDESWGVRTEGVASSLDVVGYNYMADRYEKEEELFPNRVLYASESFPRDIDKNWAKVEKLPYAIGDFTWTSWDYIGESGLGRVHAEDSFDPVAEYPWHLGNCADFDICGFRKPQSYYREIVWCLCKEPYIAVHDPEEFDKGGKDTAWSWDNVFNSWDWPGYESKGIKIDVYSDAEEVELLLNGKSLGREKVGCDHRFTGKFETKYEVGELIAVAYVDGKEVSQSSIRTADKAYKLAASSDRSTCHAGQQDLAYISIEVLDEKGNLASHSDCTIRVEVEGEGTLIGFGTGNPLSDENYTSAITKAYKGRAMAIIRTTKESGSIKLTAKSEGLNAAVVEVTSL